MIFKNRRSCPSKWLLLFPSFGGIWLCVYRFVYSCVCVYECGYRLVCVFVYVSVCARVLADGPVKAVIWLVTRDERAQYGGHDVSPSLIDMWQGLNNSCVLCVYKGARKRWTERGCDKVIGWDVWQLHRTFECFFTKFVSD